MAMESLGYPRHYDETSPNLARLFDLSGRVAVITGGAAGIGRAIGLGFARFGADVVVVDLAVEQAEATAAEIRKLGRRAEVMDTDVTSLDQVQDMVARVRGLLGRIDVCVNSAGGGIRKPILELSPEEWQFVVGLNLTGTWNTARAVGELMVAQRHGKMINLASIYGHVANLGGEGHGDEKRSAAHGLISFHHRRHGPLRHDEGELLLNAAQALKSIPDRVDSFLKRQSAAQQGRTSDRPASADAPASSGRRRCKSGWA